MSKKTKEEGKVEEQLTDSAKRLASLDERVTGNSEELANLKKKVTREYSDFPLYYPNPEKAPEIGRADDQQKLARRIVDLGELTECEHFPDDEESVIKFVRRWILNAKPTWNESTLVPSTFSEFHDNAATRRVLACGCNLPNEVGDGEPHRVKVKFFSEDVEKEEGKGFRKNKVTEKKFRSHVFIATHDHNGNYTDEEEFKTEWYSRKVEAAVATYRIITREHPRWFFS